jgi:hypothetical protein
MSDLDKAIREHLELKRLRGADPREVARIEREALSAVPRDRTEAFAPEHQAEVHVFDERPQLREPAHSAWPVATGAARFAHIDAAEETQEFSIEHEAS